ncbi:MAG: 2-hydroxyacid dehydrogenase [bacterium]|nr:2-hydroxyacid dehydrogenase [bacterium]
MNEIRIAFFDTKPYDINSFNQENSEFGFDIQYFEDKLNNKTVSLAKGFDAVCVFVNDDLNKTVIKKLTEYGIRIIALRCAGYNNVDFKAAFNNIHVVRVPDYSPYAVAEHSITLMLALNRKIHKAYYRTRDNNFNINGLLGFDMYRKTAGIIGTGKIGQILIKILKGFQMEVLACDPLINEELSKELGFKYVELDYLLSNSDIISLNCPLNSSTHHLINKDSISKLKPGVMLINTGRGSLLDTKALIDGLKSKKIGAAGLDVYEEESEYFFEDFSSEIVPDDTLTRLLTFPNVILTSHQAFFTREALHNIAEVTLLNIKHFFNSTSYENEICYQCKRPCRKTRDEDCFK